MHSSCVPSCDILIKTSSSPPQPARPQLYLRSTPFVHMHLQSALASRSRLQETRSNTVNRCSVTLIVQEVLQYVPYIIWAQVIGGALTILMLRPSAPPLRYPPLRSPPLRCYNKVLQLRPFKGRAPDYEGILLYWLMAAKVRPCVAKL